MRLLIIRHGKAEERSGSLTHRHQDAERRLTDAGRKDMRKAAKGLREIAPKIDVLATSPLVRARETADIIAHAERRERRYRGPRAGLEQLCKPPDRRRHHLPVSIQEGRLLPDRIPRSPESWKRDATMASRTRAAAKDRRLKPARARLLETRTPAAVRRIVFDCRPPSSPSAASTRRPGSAARFPRRPAATAQHATNLSPGCWYATGAAQVAAPPQTPCARDEWGSRRRGRSCVAACAMPTNQWY